jgi:hypothetical protein
MLTKINKNISLQQFLPLSEAEILHPAQANIGQRSEMGTSLIR